ncbi:hypothetical protein ANANG_G00067050 [Anguilla anguilla]|uniref:Uncharacterized protein n=1 Tax=Anguilla anguilla TaxID=7936 RepID=A0A9D3MPZ8_ANGAN|nr:hypothetical protein ANANG_G00067050 [Anguilla anguilla]
MLHSMYIKVPVSLGPSKSWLAGSSTPQSGRDVDAFPDIFRRHADKPMGIFRLSSGVVYKQRTPREAMVPVLLWLLNNTLQKTELEMKCNLASRLLHSAMEGACFGRDS